MPPKNANRRRASSTRRPLITETLETRTLLSSLPNPSVAPFPAIAKVAVPALGGGANQPSVALTGLSGDLNANDRSFTGLVSGGNGLTIAGQIFPSSAGVLPRDITFRIEDSQNTIYGSLSHADFSSTGNTGLFSIPVTGLPTGTESYHLEIEGHNDVSTDTFNSGASRLFFPQFTITVDPGPTASTGSFSTTENAATTYALTGRNTGGTSLTYSTATSPSHSSAFSINANTGIVSYTPRAQYVGTDSFAFKVTDNFGQTATATVSVTVNHGTAASSVPTTTSLATRQGITLNGSVSASANTDGNALTYVKDSDPSKGTLTLNSDGTFSFVPAAGLAGSGLYQFTYHAHDAVDNLNSNTGIVSIEVVPTPVINSGFQTSPGVAGSSPTKSTTLILSGTAEPGSTVTIAQGGVALSPTTTADATTGIWTYTINSGLNGLGNPTTYLFTASSRDSSGNTSAISSSLSVQIDTVAPATPVITGISPDTGTAGDGVTSATAFTLSGTAEPGSTVIATQDGNSVGTAIVADSGVWSIALGNVTPLADGTYHESVTATDLAGNLSTAATTTVVVDTHTPAAPVITGISPDTGTAGDGVTSARAFTLSGTAEAASSVVVTLQGTSTVVGTTTAASSGAWSIAVGNVTPLADGTYHYRATATDLAGVSSVASNTLDITVDSHKPDPPTITSISPDDGTAGQNLSHSATITLAGTAEANSLVTIRRLNTSPATVVGSVTADGLGHWSFTPAALADGIYPLAATATDLAGTASDPGATFSITIDTNPAGTPLITSISPDTGIADDGVTSANVLTLSGIATAGSFVTVRNVDTQVDLAPVVTVDSSGQWSFAISHLASPLADGTYHFTATSTDSLGSISAPSNPFTVVVDTHTPSVPTITGITHNAGTIVTPLTNQGTFTLLGSTDPHDTVAVSDGETGQLLGTTVADGSGAWTFAVGSVTRLGDGTHHFTAIATDLAGISSGPTAAFAVEIDTHVPSKPTITGISPDTGTPGDGVTSASAFSLSGLAEPGSLVTVINPNTLAVIGTTAANVSGRWTFAIGQASPLADGTYPYAATATDLARTTGPASDPFTVVVDTHTPAMPTITGITPDTGTPADGITSATSILLNGTAEPRSTITVTDLDANVVVGTAVSDGSGVWTFAVSSLAQGVHHYAAIATDLAGITGPSGPSFRVTILTTTPAAPSAHLDAASDTGRSSTDGITADQTPTFEISGIAANSTVQLLRDGQIVATTVSQTGGMVALTEPQAVPDGTYQYTARQVDQAGNVGTSTSAIRVVIDTVSPSLNRIIAVSPTPRNTAVSTVDLVFSEPIDPASFSAADLALTLDGRNVVIAPGVSLTPVSGSTFRIGGLAATTAPGGLPISGSYVLTVTSSTVRDLAGNAAAGTGSTPFVIDTARPAILSIGPVSPSPRTSAVSTVDLVFSKPIDPTSLTASALSLSLNGQTLPIGSLLTVSPLSNTSYRISGLNNLTTAHRAPLSGTYVLTIDASAIRDNVGNAGVGTTSARFVIDTIPAKVSGFSTVVSPRATPVSVVSVSLSKPIDLTTLGLQDIALTRDGQTIPLTSDVKVVPVSPSAFQVTGLNNLTTVGGAYVLTVSANFRDALGNTGGGNFTTSWVVDHTPPVIVGIHDLTVQATSATGAFVPFPTIVASDIVDLNDPLVVTPGSGSFFPVGSTTVTCVSTDKSGNTATATFQVNVLPAHLTPPTVAPTSFLATRQGIHQLVLRFSEPMNALQAATSTQYQLAQYVRLRRGKGLGLQPIAISQATYDPATQSVTLSLAKTLPLRQTVRLLVLGANLSDTYGNVLAGSPTGQAGTNFVVNLGPQTPVVYTDRHKKVMKSPVAPATIRSPIVHAALAAKLSTGRHPALRSRPR